MLAVQSLLGDLKRGEEISFFIDSFELQYTSSIILVDANLMRVLRSKI